MKQQEERRKRKKKKKRKKKMKEKKKNKKAEGEQIPPPTKKFEGVCLVDTTVILAQPRVSRLRADAVYVDWRSFGGLPRSASQDRGFSNVIPGAETPFFWPTDRGI